MLGKAELLAALAGKNRGVLANPTDRQAILALAAQLEDRNPTPHPLASTDLAGDWQLLYTSSTELLGLDRFPLVKLGPIYQCIRPQTQRVYNVAELYGVPWCEGLVSVVASFRPATEPATGTGSSSGQTPDQTSGQTSGKRVVVQFERAIIGLQRIYGYQSPSQWVSKIEAGQRFFPLDFPIQPRTGTGTGTGKEAAWLETTYLDQDLRISRGNQGNLFILSKGLS
jgi:hypothetical protein